MADNRPQPFDLSGAAQPGPPPSGDDEFALGPRGGAGELAAANEPALPPVASDSAPVVRPAGTTIRPPKAWPVYLAAAVASVLWALAPVLYIFADPRGVQPLKTDGAALIAFSLLALGPIALVWIAAYLVQQGRGLAAEARRARALSESLLAPAALAARAASSTVEAVRVEIKRASDQAAQAQAELLTLRDALASESERLVEAAANSSRAAGAITQSLAGEREKLETLTAALGAGAAKVTEAISSQSKMVAEASDLAETQIREAEAALAARAADLAAAASEAGHAAKAAGDTLATQVERLETVGANLGDQARAIEVSLSEQRAGLVTAAHGMRADHETYAVETETLRAQLAEIVAHAREGSAELGQTATHSAEVLRQMIAASSEQLAVIARTAGEERDRLSAQAAQSLAAVSELAAREREAVEAGARATIETLAAGAEQARRVADEHVEAARGELAQLGEAAQAARTTADAAFETRLAEARQIIEQTAHLVDEAGAQTTDRLNAGVQSARDALAGLESVLTEVDQRLARAPVDAEARTTAIRQNVERGIEALMDFARHAAEETRSIDAAFQDRVRRNYDMLSEAVRLMGVVAGAGSTAGTQRPAPQPAAPPPVAPTELTRAASAPAQAPAQPVSPPADPPGLRPRLKLTPTATDEEFKTVFAAAGGREQAESIGDSWTWKELLTSMDTPAADDGALATALLAEVEAMGIDAAALVPRARIDEIAAALTVGDAATGREMVRRLAPAAVRRLSRRVMADRAFHGQAERYVRRYAGMVIEASKREGDGFSVAGLIGSDQGRAFLLLDAAIIDAA